MPLCARKNCTGCLACLNACESAAISIEYDAFGFSYPAVDENKCSACNACNEVCPILNTRKNETPTHAAAAWINDSAVRMKSSSGGIFSALAASALNKGWSVCGAAFVDGLHLKHIVISDFMELRSLLGSKYLQSDISEVYFAIKKLLESGKQVLLAGVPCQIAGIKSYLKKEHETLLTIDLLCSGVASQAIFNKYTDRFARDGGQILNVSFRDKEFGWNQFAMFVEYLKDNKVCSYKQIADKDPYMRAFQENLIIRDSCGNCKFATTERCGDITLGDFWGIAGYDKKLDDGQGTSLVLLNTPKGAQFFSELENIFSQSVPMEVAIQRNLSLSRPWSAHSNRVKFLHDIFSRTAADFEKTLNDHISESNDVGIFNFCSSNNYGALLTTYALYNILKEMGLVAKVVHYVPLWHERWFGSLFHFFAMKYMDLSPCCRSRSDLMRLNPLFSTFIMGSDQVFRPQYVKSAFDTYFLGWTDKSKRRIAYAASFGVDQWEADDDAAYTNMVGACLKAFDAVSVREKSGVNIGQNTFGIESTFVLDPVFLYDKWDSLINAASEKNKFDAAVNVFDHAENVANAIEALNCTSINILNGLTPENWLWHIKNCEFVITDSFHCLCFAIIFKKQFVCISNRLRGQERIKSLLDIFGFSGRMIDISDLDKLRGYWLDDRMDYEQSCDDFTELKRASHDFLYKSLNIPVLAKNTDVRDELVSSFLRTKRNNELPKLKMKYWKAKFCMMLPFGKKWRSRYTLKKTDLKLKIKAWREMGISDK